MVRLGGFTNIQQNLYIAPMSNPYTLSGERVSISVADEHLGALGGPPYINEGPQVLPAQRQGVRRLLGQRQLDG